MDIAESERIVARIWTEWLVRGIANDHDSTGLVLLHLTFFNYSVVYLEHVEAEFFVRLITPVLEELESTSSLSYILRTFPNSLHPDA